ncbi:MAG: hypothetical protein RR894_07920 [Terrisporobacter sp.]
MYKIYLNGNNLEKRQFGVIGMKTIQKLDKSRIIINILCNHLDEDFKDFKNNIRKKDNKYLLLLLLKNYKCLNREQIKLLLNINSDKSINYNIRKAEEKFLINKDFRDIYLVIEKYLEDVI